MVVVSLVVTIIALFAARGILYRIFVNVLMAAGVVTLTAWILLVVTGILFCYGIPIYCAVTGKDLVTVYRNIDQGRW